MCVCVGWGVGGGGGGGGGGSGAGKGGMEWGCGWGRGWEVSLMGAATSIIFVMANVSFVATNKFCHDKSRLVATK